jgi:hypothetical protein
MAAKTTAPAKPTTAEIKADVETALEALTTADTQEKVDGLSAQIQELLKGLRANQRVGLEMRRKDAVAKAGDRLKEAAKGSTAVVAKASASWKDMEGGEDEAQKLMAAGVERIQKGAEIGLKAADLFKEVANVIFEGRLRLKNKQGLPDITAKSQGARDLATEMFETAKANISAEQVDLLEFHASLKKGVQNRLGDVAVEFLRALATTPVEEAAKSFPFLEGADLLDDQTPETLVRKVYADAGIQLPAQTRAEIAKADRERKALEAKASEQTGAGESEGEGEGEGSGEGAEDQHSPKENKLLTSAAKLVEDAKKLGKGTTGLSDEVKAELKAKVDAALAELAKASAALAG